MLALSLTQITVHKVFKTHSKETIRQNSTIQVLIANCEVIYLDWYVLVVNLRVNKQIIS